MTMSGSKANRKMMLEIEFKVLFECSDHLTFIVLSIRRFVSQVSLYRNTGEHTNICVNQLREGQPRLPESTTKIPYYDDDVVCDFSHGYWKITDCKLNQVGYHDIIDRRLLLQLSE